MCQFVSAALVMFVGIKFKDRGGNNFDMLFSLKGIAFLVNKNDVKKRVYVVSIHVRGK